MLLEWTVERGKLLLLKYLHEYFWMRYHPHVQHACGSRLIVSDLLYARPTYLFLIVEREASVTEAHQLLAVFFWESRLRTGSHCE